MLHDNNSLCEINIYCEILKRTSINYIDYFNKIYNCNSHVILQYNKYNNKKLLNSIIMLKDDNEYKLDGTYIQCNNSNHIWIIDNDLINITCYDLYLNLIMKFNVGDANCVIEY